MENQNKEGKLWFKAKMFGWGWYPSSWEGWSVLLLYIIALVLHIRNVEKYPASSLEVVLNFAIPFIINTIFLIIVCFVKGEKPRWRWGK